MNTDVTLDVSDKIPDSLLSDEQLAKVLNLSTAWIRKQRYLRKKGQQHSLIVDPVMIGDTPRYRSSDIGIWLNSL